MGDRPPIWLGAGTLVSIALVAPRVVGVVVVAPPRSPPPSMEMLVECHDFPTTGRGLRVVRDVAAGEELLAVPLSLCWHAAASRAALSFLPAALSELDVVAVHLLLEQAKGAESVHAEHMAAIPLKYDSTLFWSDSELAALRGSPWLELAERFAEEAAADWRALQEALATSDDEANRGLLERHGIGWEQYLWAYATVKSRAA